MTAKPAGATYMYFKMYGSAVQSSVQMRVFKPDLSQNVRHSRTSISTKGHSNPNIPANMPHSGSIRGSKRRFRAKRADKHPALRVDPRFKTTFSGQTCRQTSRTAGRSAVQNFVFGTNQHFRTTIITAPRKGIPNSHY